MDHLSYSSANTLAECGEKFRLTKLVKVPQMPGWALIGGRAVHTTTERLDQIEYGEEPDGPSAFADVFHEEIEHQKLSTALDESDFKVSGKATAKWPEKENKDWWLFHGPVFVNTYISWRNRYPAVIWRTPDDALAVEIKMEYRPNGPDSEPMVLGFIDRIFEHPDGTLEVVDLKSGKNKPKDKIQLSTYAWGLPNFWPRPVTGSFMMARTGELIRYDVSGDEENVRAYYLGAHAAVETKNYPARPSWICNYCSVKDYCWAKDGEFAEAVRPIGSK
jgi:hypothetical protein